MMDRSKWSNRLTKSSRSREAPPLTLCPSTGASPPSWRPETRCSNRHRGGDRLAANFKQHKMTARQLHCLHRLQLHLHLHQQLQPPDRTPTQLCRQHRRDNHGETPVACHLHVSVSRRHRGKPCGACSMHTFIDDTSCRVHHPTNPRYRCSQTHTS